MTIAEIAAVHLLASRTRTLCNLHLADHAGIQHCPAGMWLAIKPTYRCTSCDAELEAPRFAYAAAPARE